SPAQRDEARCQEEIDVAASHGERTNEGVCAALETRLGNVAPLDLMGRRAGELSHSSLLRRRWCSISLSTSSNARAFAALVAVIAPHPHSAARSARAPATPNTMPVMISSTAVTHENQLTCVCGSDTKLSLRVQKPGSTCAYVGSTCVYMNRAALANPATIAACGAHRVRRNTRTTAIRTDDGLDAAGDHHRRRRGIEAAPDVITAVHEDRGCEDDRRRPQIEVGRVAALG